MRILHDIVDVYWWTLCKEVTELRDSIKSLFTGEEVIYNDEV